VQIQDVNRDIADSVGLDRARGALVTTPTEDGPAAEAGIQSGDIIVEVDGDAIDNALDLSRTIAGKAPGSAVDLTIWRDRAEQTISVQLEELTAEAAAPTPPAEVTPDEPAQPTPSSVGLTLVPNADAEGLLVQDIDPESVAADKGFAVGDAILEVDNQVVTTAQEFEDAIAGVRDSGRQTVLVKASRNGAVRFIGLPLEAAN